MSARRGQVALYLVLVLVAICLLTMMNVETFLAVSAKNRTMNCGDAAALAVAKYQGELLNRIGTLNIEHLEAAIKNDEERCRQIFEEQQRLCFLSPLEGIRIGNDVARNNGAEPNDGMRDILKRHVMEIRTIYEPNPESYPEPWEGAWEEYAIKLELMIGGGIWAGPDNIDFIDAANGHYLLLPMFYHAIAGRNWCWFYFHAQGLLDSYAGFKDWGPLPGADLESRLRKAVNSEVYSLNLQARTGSALILLGKEKIMELTKASEEDLDNSLLLRDPLQSWFFYDANIWRKWWEIDPDGPWRFPVVGAVKPEYDIRGCAAICRVMQKIPDLVDGNDATERMAKWSGAAKPFGIVGSADFVIPVFSEAHLVPLDSVGGADLSTADPDWMRHVREHLSRYLEQGAGYPASCYYCAQLQLWEHPSLRSQARNWLKYNSNSCQRGDGPGGGIGGTPHGH